MMSLVKQKCKSSIYVRVYVRATQLCTLLLYVRLWADVKVFLQDTPALTKQKSYHFTPADVHNKTRKAFVPSEAEIRMKWFSVSFYKHFAAFFAQLTDPKSQTPNSHFFQMHIQMTYIHSTCWVRMYVCMYKSIYVGCVCNSINFYIISQQLERVPFLSSSVFLTVTTCLNGKWGNNESKNEIPPHFLLRNFVMWVENSKIM